MFGQEIGMKDLVYPNWEVRWAYDKAFGRAVDITKEIGIDKKSVKPLEGGLYSRELGSTTDTDKEIREFTCNCGKLHGRHREGDICDDCGTMVTEQYGVDLDKYGWIDIAPYYIITPGAYAMLISLIGAKALERILNYDVPIDAEGVVSHAGISTRSYTSKGAMYNSIGIMEFKRRFEEIVTYFGRIKPKKAEHAAILLKMKSRVFSSKIPVFSSLMRPAYASGKRKMFSYDKINSSYTSILINFKLLKRGATGRMRLSALATLYSIQLSLFEIYNLVFETKLIGKYKKIRKNVLSNRASFSARAVATSLVGKNAGVNHIVLPYKMFLKLYQLELMNCMMRGYAGPLYKTMTIYELLELIRNALYSDELHEDLYKLMKFMIKNHKQGLWVNGGRNPSMDMLSIQYFRVVDVDPNPNNKVVKIQTTSLVAYNGDFDGDEFNIFSPKELCVHQAFLKGINPRYMMIDRTGDNYFNRDFNVLKEHATNLVAFTTPIDVKER